MPKAYNKSLIVEILRGRLDPQDDGEERRARMTVDEILRAGDLKMTKDKTSLADLAATGQARNGQAE